MNFYSSNFVGRDILNRSPCIIIYWNEKVDSLQSWTLQKIPIISKNVLNKNCLELNFLQKTQRLHMSISLRSGGRGTPNIWWCNFIRSSIWKLKDVYNFIVSFILVFQLLLQLILNCWPTCTTKGVSCYNFLYMSPCNYFSCLLLHSVVIKGTIEILPIRDNYLFGSFNTWNYWFFINSSPKTIELSIVPSMVIHH